MMAKTKPKRLAKTTKELSDKQIEQLGNSLIDTGKNIYLVSQAMFGIKADDDTFDRLQKISKIFRCEDCSQWLPIGDMVPDFQVCGSCMEERDNDE